MFVIAHANHPEMFLAGIAVGVVLALTSLVWKRAKK